MNNLFSRQNSLIFSIYVGGILSYNIFTIYSNGSEQLLEYRKTKQIFKNEIESIISGSQKKWFDNLLLSLFWPIRLPFQIVPILILNLNNKTNDSKQVEFTKVTDTIKPKQDEINNDYKIEEIKNEEKTYNFNLNEGNTLPFNFSAGHEK
jgi:hypothetical protein